MRLATQPASVRPRARIASADSSAWLRQPSRTPTTSSTGRRKPRAMSSMSMPRRRAARSAPPAPSTTTTSARAASAVERGRDRREVDRRRLPRRAARCGAIGGANAYGLRSRERRVDVAGGRQRGDVGVEPLRRPRCPRRPASCPTARTPGGDERAQQRARDDGLADAGVGAGDEDAARVARHPVTRRAAARLTIGVALGRALAARPSTRGRRRPRTSPECGRRRASRSSAREHPAPACRARQAARAAARRVGRADRLQLAQQRAGDRRRSA